MRKKKKYTLITSGIFFVLFLVMILLVKFVDVQPIGPEGSSIGLSKLNGAFAKLFPFSNFWYKLTNIAGYLCILYGLCFALIGLRQLIRRKSLAKVDKTLYALAGFFVLLGIVYVFFEVVKVNYRPVIIDPAEGLEASFPSSHTVLSCSLMGAIMIELKCLLRKRSKRLPFDFVCILLMVITILGRIFSGAHWITDIIAGIFLSGALAFLFYYVIIRIRIKERKARKSWDYV